MIELFDLDTTDDDIGRFYGKDYAGKIFLRRLDLIHPVISGNKWFKLKYNLKAGLNAGCKTFVSFGGVYSNHLAALAAACKIAGVNSVGIIRGEKPARINSVLQYMQEQGMELIFVSRSLYRNRNEVKNFSFILDGLDKPFLIPEGGANEYGVKGAMEILKSSDSIYSHIILAVGSGTMMAGILRAGQWNQKVIGFSSLKGAEGYLEDVVQRWLPDKSKAEWSINHNFHFGGFGKSTEPLSEFIQEFKSYTGINIEPVYTAKMLFGLREILHEFQLKDDEKILVIHSGGFNVKE